MGEIVADKDPAEHDDGAALLQPRERHHRIEHLLPHVGRHVGRGGRPPRPDDDVLLQDLKSVLNIGNIHHCRVHMAHDKLHTLYTAHTAQDGTLHATL